MVVIITCPYQYLMPCLPLFLVIFSGVIQLIGCIVFGVEFDDVYYDRTVGGAKWEFWLSYAFGMAIVAALLEIVAGVLLILECKKGGGTSASG